MIARIVRRLGKRSGCEGNYWVMESPQRDHVGIHRGECRMCKDGNGPRPDRATGLWHGRFSSYQQAREMALSTGRPFEIGGGAGNWRVCKPEKSVPSNEGGCSAVASSRWTKITKTKKS